MLAKRLLIGLAMAGVLLGGCNYPTPTITFNDPATRESQAHSPTRTARVNLIATAVAETVAAQPTPVPTPRPDVLLLGFYSFKLDELHQLDAFVTGQPDGRSTSIVHIFTRFNEPVPADSLEGYWTNGYATFINLNQHDYPMSEWAAGLHDDLIAAWAQGFKAWVDRGENRFAYIALWQEMNGSWRTYGLDPESFKAAFVRVQQIFIEQGVPDGAVKWAFAPNGWSPTAHRFENYYPGDEFVDVVGFSGYNYGYCVGLGPAWATPEQVYNPPDNPEKPDEPGRYLDRMVQMAPEKPIFIIETGASPLVGPDQVDTNQRDAWLLEAYQYLAQFPAVRAILYFNTADIRPQDNVNCDYRVFSLEGEVAPSVGYRAASQLPRVQYASPAWLAQQSLRP